MSSTATPHPEGSPDFVFKDVNESDAPNIVNGALPVSTFLVSYNDGQGKSQVRLCFRVPGSDATFIIQERISGAHVVTNAHAWFHKALVNKLKDLGLEKSKIGETVGSV
jgi:hypothetical protein